LVGLLKEDREDKTIFKFLANLKNPKPLSPLLDPLKFVY
jgi:hypothetical protein